MGYYNPIFSYGLARFARVSGKAGVDGLIVVDLPHEEINPLFEVCAPLGIHIIPLLAPTSTEASIKASVSNAGGFVYCVGLTGVTGARAQVSQRSFDLLRRVRPHTHLPLAVGFGISRRDHVEEVCREAEAAVVGSALIRVMLDSSRERLTANASALVAELAGMPFPAGGGTP
jgi:tryptophan synthase alpha subunit